MAPIRSVKTRPAPAPKPKIAKLAAKPNPKPAPKPPADAAAKPGHSEDSVYETKPKKNETKPRGRGPTSGQNDTTAGFNDTTVVFNDSSVGFNDSSVGFNDTSVGFNDTSVGRPGTRAPVETDVANVDAGLVQLPEASTKKKISKIQENVRKLPIDDATRQKLARDAANVKVAARLESMMSSLGAVPGPTQNEMYKAFAKDPLGESGRVVTWVASSPRFKTMVPLQKAQMSQVLGETTERGIRAVGKMLYESPQKLSDMDKDGNTLLANMAKVATQPLNDEIVARRAVSRAELIEDVAVDVLFPRRVDQGPAGTCSVTSVQAELVQENPSEYARLISGLVGPEGKATMRGGGVMELQSEYIKKGNRDGRSYTEVYFQDAAMELANGADDYDAAKGRSFSSDPAKLSPYAGLYPAQQAGLLENAFGEKYRQWSAEQPFDREKQKTFLQSYAPRTERRPVILHLGLEDPKQVPYDHAVSFVKVDGGRLYYRDPYGSARAENNFQVEGEQYHRDGIYSIPMADYDKRVFNVHVPERAAERLEKSAIAPELNLAVVEAEDLAPRWSAKSQMLLA